MLIYPVHHSGPNDFTIVTVTNTNTTPATPVGFGGSVNLHFEYVNSSPDPETPFCPVDCSIFDRHEFLTPADTLSVLTRCHNAFAPGGQEGYLVVAAQSPAQFDVDICHDYLIGSEIVINASGVMYSINAIPAQCGPTLAPGAATDQNGNGQLDFNGVEYTVMPDRVIIDSYVALAGSQLALVNLTGEFQDTNDLYFSVWNDNEFPLSATLRFKCWFDQPLMRISPLFDESFLQSVANDPQELDINCDGIGDVETGWAIVDSRGVTSAGGTQIASDGVVVGAITAGVTSSINGGRLLWHSDDSQSNGTFHGRPNQPGNPGNPGTTGNPENL